MLYYMEKRCINEYTPLVLCFIRYYNTSIEPSPATLPSSVPSTPKVYLVDPIIQKVQSITTLEDQNLVLDRIDVENIVGKKVCIVDDVVSTGGSLNALQILLEKINCEVICKAAVLLEEAGYDKDDLLYLERLPIFSELE